MNTLKNTKLSTDILFKYADFITSYEDFLVESKNKISGFWSALKLWLIGKALYYAFLFFIKDKLNEEIDITATNYNFYSQRKDKFRELVNLQKENYTHISSQKLSWSLRSLLLDFSSVFEQIEIYTQRLEFVLTESDHQLNEKINILSQIPTIDFDSYSKPIQNVELIGSIESDESIEDLLALLTK